MADKVMFLVNAWNESITVSEYDSETEKSHNVTYFWYNKVVAELGSENIKKHYCSDSDFNVADIMSANNTSLKPDGSNSGSKFSLTIKNEIKNFNPNVLVVEFGMNAYKNPKTDYSPITYALDIMESYKEIYNYCHINGISMVIVVYEEPDLSKSKDDNIDNYKKYLNKLIEQQQIFAKTRNLECIDLKSSSGFTASTCYTNTYKLNKNGHLKYAELLITACNNAKNKYTANISQIAQNQKEIVGIKASYIPQVEKFKAKETKIAFLNATYIDQYCEPQVSGGSISGTSSYFWASLAAARLGNPPWKMFWVRRRPMTELIRDQAWDIVAYAPTVIVLESGLFDYTITMYDGEPTTRVGDVVAIYAFIYKYCIENNVALVVSTYGILDYEYYKKINPDDPLFTESHKRYHAALQERVMDFCYLHDITCNNIRLDERFELDNFPIMYLEDGVSLSRLGHIAYSEDVASAIKIALEKMDKYIKETETANSEANSLSRYYASVYPTKNIGDTVDKILKNIDLNTDYTQERPKALVNNVDPNLPVIIDESMEVATNNIMEYMKKRKSGQTSKNTQSNSNNSGSSNTTNNTDPLTNNNKFQNIANILKKKTNTDNMIALTELLPPTALKSVKESAQSQEHAYLKVQAEQERLQNIQNSITKTEGEELIGDGQIDDPELVVSFEICCMLDRDEDHHCKYMDIENRCIFEQCIYDTEELPKFTRKWYTKCLICTEVFDRDPRYMKAPFCDSCISRMQAAEKLPFTCINCGQTQETPSLIMFSSICDYCVQHNLFNTCCLEFAMSPKGIHGVDTNHEPVY